MEKQLLKQKDQIYVNNNGKKAPLRMPYTKTSDGVG
jgi:hypothetical protein